MEMTVKEYISKQINFLQSLGYAKEEAVCIAIEKAILAMIGNHGDGKSVEPEVLSALYK